MNERDVMQMANCGIAQYLCDTRVTRFVSCSVSSFTFFSLINPSDRLFPQLISGEGAGGSGLSTIETTTS